MLFRAFVIASAVCMTSLAYNMAMAEDMAPPAQPSAVSGISFNESESGLGAVARTIRLDLSVGGRAFGRAERLNEQISPRADGDGRRSYEVAVSTSADVAGVPLDVAVAQRATLQISEEGDIGAAGGGQEVRIGRRLRNLARGLGGNLVGRWRSPTWDNPTWYFFAAKDDEALAWTPGRRSAHTISYQENRVEVGDRQAGVAIEAGGVQAALAYVERKVSGRYGSSHENFAGVTLTWRR